MARAATQTNTERRSNGKEIELKEGIAADEDHVFGHENTTSMTQANPNGNTNGNDRSFLHSKDTVDLVKAMQVMTATAYSRGYKHGLKCMSDNWLR